jgi:hypothetical protein
VGISVGHGAPVGAMLSGGAAVAPKSASPQYTTQKRADEPHEPSSCYSMYCQPCSLSTMQLQVTDEPITSVAHALALVLGAHCSSTQLR